MTASSPAKGKLAWGLVIVLGVLHYDFWYWADRSLVFGFMPIGLLWHALISIGAAVAWALVIRYAWPNDLEDWASADDEPGAGGEHS